jgi:hypothetical protein
MRKEEDAKKAEIEEGVEGEVLAAAEPAREEPKEDKSEFDIEADIAAEVKSMRRPTTEPLFTNVRMDVQCGMLSSSLFLLHHSYILQFYQHLHSTFPSFHQASTISNTTISQVFQPQLKHYSTLPQNTPTNPPNLLHSTHLPLSLGHRNASNTLLQTFVTDDDDGKSE